jgi:hypothetical protein
MPSAGSWQVDNHGVNREALIKAYDVLVKSPEDRKKLERTAPLLVATRDQAVIELKREKLAAELNQRNLKNRQNSIRPKYHDTYTEDVKKLIEDKAKGQKRQAPPTKPARSNVIDIVAALQESLAQKKSRKARRCLTPIRSDPPPLVAAAAFDIANALHMNGGIGL